MDSGQKVERSPYFWALVATLYTVGGLIGAVTSVFWFMAGSWIFGTLQSLLSLGVLWGTKSFWRAFAVLRKAHKEFYGDASGPPSKNSNRRGLRPASLSHEKRPFNSR